MINMLLEKNEFKNALHGDITGQSSIIKDTSQSDGGAQANMNPSISQRDSHIVTYRSNLSILDTDRIQTGSQQYNLQEKNQRNLKTEMSESSVSNLAPKISQKPSQVPDLKDKFDQDFLNDLLSPTSSQVIPKKQKKGNVKITRLKKAKNKTPVFSKPERDVS